MSKSIVHTHAGDDSDGKMWGIEGINILLILAGLILSVALSLLLFRQQAHSVLFSFGVGFLPFVASAVMKGLSGTTASLQAGVRGTMQATGLAVGTGLTVAGAATAFGGSAAAQAAIEGTKFATDTASSVGLISNDYSRVHGGPAQDVGGGANVPAPPPLTPAPVGERTSSESNPSLTAHQTAPNSFAVVDQDKGTISYHRGNIFTPRAAQAAFNSHSAHAKPLQTVPPPLPTSPASKGNQSA